MLEDYSVSYKQMLKKSGKSSLDIRREQKPSIEIDETLNNLNPNFIKEIFELKLILEQNEINLIILKRKQIAFGSKT